jgi:hypothetical protein
MIDDAEDIASLLVPINITEDMIGGIKNGTGAAVLPEDPAPAFDPAHTYMTGDRVHSTATHRVYESAKDNNTGRNPAIASNQFTASGVPTWWIEVGPTNRWAMLDGLISTATEGDSPLVITLRPGSFDGLALFGLSGDTLTVEVRSSANGTLLYTTGTDMPLEGSQPGDYDEYFFSAFKPKTEFIATGIPQYGNPVVTITIKKPTGTAGIGLLAIGNVRKLGVPERGARVSPRTYSYFEEDAFGNIRVRKRPSAKGVTIPIKVALEDADEVIQMIEDLLSDPVVVIGSTAVYHNKLNTFGLISGEMDYSTYPYRTLALTVKGFA